MEDRETPRMRKYGESKTTLIMMAIVPHVTSVSGLKKFQADVFLFDRVYLILLFHTLVVASIFSIIFKHYDDNRKQLHGSDSCDITDAILARKVHILTLFTVG